ncbi:MAG: hypothetical protein GDA56_12740 [Hormoscilla sp. GM7CHS1pb]|nr:hypothetical protein [Hormoscilla sp. GM7CHS1pb]
MTNVDPNGDRAKISVGWVSARKPNLQLKDAQKPEVTRYETFTTDWDLLERQSSRTIPSLPSLLP